MIEILPTGERLARVETLLDEMAKKLDQIVDDVAELKSHMQERRGNENFTRHILDALKLIVAAVLGAAATQWLHK